MSGIRFLRSIAIVAAVAVTATAVTGCHRSAVRGPEPTVPLIVRNDGVFSVTIYALPSASSDLRIRLGTVTSVAETRIAVPRRGLQPDGSLRLMLHAIGARSSWVSPSILVPTGGAAYLDIYSNPSGDLSRSALYALATTTASVEREAR